MLQWCRLCSGVATYLSALCCSGAGCLISVRTYLPAHKIYFWTQYVIIEEERCKYALCAVMVWLNKKYYRTEKNARIGKILAVNSNKGICLFCLI